MDFGSLGITFGMLKLSSTRVVELLPIDTREVFAEEFYFMLFENPSSLLVALPFEDFN